MPYSIVDDTDLGTVANLKPVYDLLHELGFKTTKTVWVRKGLNPDPIWASSQTLEDKDYLEFVLELQRQGFEIAMHMTAPGTSCRSETISAYQTFRKVFGHYSKMNINHSSNTEDIYWGRNRLDSPFLQALYDKVTRWDQFWGHVESSEFFWGDICQKHTKYVRNFTFRSVNTLRVNPGMPYHDKRRPYVNYWFSSSIVLTIKSALMLCVSLSDRMSLSDDSFGNECLTRLAGNAGGEPVRRSTISKVFLAALSSNGGLCSVCRQNFKERV